MNRGARRSLGLLVTLILGLLVAPGVADAQPRQHVHRIGRLSTGSPLREQPIVEPFLQGLRDLGYVEGQNLVIEQRYAEGQVERLPALAAELVALQVEVIVARGDAAVRAAQHATATIPIVMALAFEAVEAGFVANLARPEGNTTGVSFLGAQLPQKQLELFKEALPQIARVAVLANPAVPGHALRLHHLTVAGRALGLSLHILELRRAEELDTAFAAMRRAGAEALFVLSDPLLLNDLRGRIADLAAQSRLPAMYGWKMYVEAGGLMSYGPRLPDLNRRAAYYVDRLLKGAKPADLPVEQPTKFELVVNLKTADALGLTIPPTLLFQADEVIR
jgi:putative tryptophan/tyrosine transport system substrate-binding protein